MGSDVYNDLKNGDADFTVVVDGVAQKVNLSDYIVKNNDGDAGKGIIKKALPPRCSSMMTPTTW